MEIVYCDGFTNALLERVANMKGLRRLTVIHCNELTDDSKEIFLKSRQLEHLEIECKSISKSVVDEIHAGLPNVKTGK